MNLFLRQQGSLSLLIKRRERWKGGDIHLCIARRVGIKQYQRDGNGWWGVIDLEGGRSHEKGSSKLYRPGRQNTKP